jgi:sugar O-acyltransferase (sialic acid O-acetyltransferase NeuD family)
VNGPVVIVGAGGHARVVVDALLCQGVEVRGFVDEDRSLHGTAVYGLPVLGADAALDDEGLAGCDLVNGLGGSGREQGSPLRRRVQERLEAAGRRFVGVCHPTAHVSSRAELAADVQVLAGAVVQPGARIGTGSVINTRAVVEHDCRLGGFVHCAPGSVVCGDVSLADDVHVGAGAVVRQGLTLGRGVVVAAGAAVVADQNVAAVLMGVPAKVRG